MRAASALCFAADTSPACPLNHSHFLPLSPLPSQAILIKSVSLAWQGKIIGEGFWMPFTLNGARFFPFSCLFFFSTPTAFAITRSPPNPHLLACGYLSFFSSVFFSSSSPSVSHPNVKYGLTSVRVRGRLLVNCKFLGQHGNLFQMANQAEQFVEVEEPLGSFSF